MSEGERPSNAPGPTGLRPLLRDITGFAGSQYFTRVATLLKGFIVAKVLGPEGNGMWQHFVLIWDYALYSHLGALPGLNKELGHRMGAKDDERAATTRDTGVGAIFGSSLVFAAMLALYALVRANQLHPVDRIGLPILGLVVVAEQLNFTYMAILRVHGKIRTITRTTSIFAISNLVVSIALLPFLGVQALLLGWLLTRSATTIMMIREGGYPFHPRIDPLILRRLLAVGFPIFLFHLTRVALRNIDRVLVDQVLERSRLGIYGLAVTIAGLAYYAAEAVAFVLYPMFLRLYGETRDATRLRDTLVKPTEFLSIAIPAGLGLTCVLIHLPILWILPEYVECIEIVRLLSISASLSCLAILPSFYLMAIDRQNGLVPIGAAIVAFDYFVGRWAIGAGYGLPGVAATMNVGTLIYAVTVIGVAGVHAYDSARRAALWVAKTLAPGVYFGAVVFLLAWGLPKTALGNAGEMARSSVAAAIFLAVSVPVLIVYERRSGFMRSLRSRSKSAS